jgi:single-strand DNA-binding protein
MNVFTFTGHLGGDAEVRYTPPTARQPNGTAVCNFSVAVNSGIGENKVTTWVRCALWGNRAEGGLPAYLLKGTLVGVSGELTAREYQVDGVTRTSLDVRVNDVTLLGSKEHTDEQAAHAAPRAPAQSAPRAPAPSAPRAPAPRQEFVDDDIPF